MSDAFRWFAVLMLGFAAIQHVAGKSTDAALFFAASASASLLSIAFRKETE